MWLRERREHSDMTVTPISLAECSPWQMTKTAISRPDGRFFAVHQRESIYIDQPEIGLLSFVLVGSGNPEEGELRPQLLDRFGLAVDVTTPTDLKLRIEIVKRRDAFERSPQSFVDAWQKEDEKIRRRIIAARKRLPQVEVPDEALTRAAQLCMNLGTDGLRGELALVRAARALAAIEGDLEVGDAHLRRMAAPALRHRLRRNPLDESGSGTRVHRAVDEVFTQTA